MKLATFLPAGRLGAGRRRGPRRRGRRVRATAPCSTASPPATARRPTATPTRSPRSRCSRRCRSRARSSASASTTPRTPPRPARELPEAPMVFLKLPSSSVPGSGPVRCPAVVKRLDYEVELAVVMGADGEIAGYAVADDVSARDLQKREPRWVRAKGFDTSCPWGPWITTADEVPDPREPAHRQPGQRRDAPGLDHRRPRVRPAGARGLHRRDLHARARRPDPHRHAAGRRPGDGPAAVPRRRATSCAARSRASARSSTDRVEARGAIDGRGPAVLLAARLPGLAHAVARTRSARSPRPASA